MKPRFRTSSPPSGLAPPGRVLKPWMSQGILLKAGTWRIWRPRDLRAIQLESNGPEGADRNVGPTLRAFRLGFRVFAGATAISV